MTYKKHHDDLQKMLTEFERVTGIGSMKTANQAMIKIIRSLVAMVETLVPDETPTFSPAQSTPSTPASVTKGCGGSCGGNCNCNTTNTTAVIAPVVPPVLMETMAMEPEIAVPAKSEPVAPVVIHEPIPEATPEPVEAVEENHPTEPAAEQDNGSEDAVKPAKKAKKPSMSSMSST